IHLFGNLLQDLYVTDQVGDSRACWLIAGIELVSDPVKKTPYPPESWTGHRVILEARRRGAILRPIGDTVILMPPLSITEAELAKLVEITVESVKAVVQGNGS